MKVEKGKFLVVKDGKEPLETESLGASLALAALDEADGVFGLWIFVLPAEKILAQPVAGLPRSFFAAEGIDEFLKALTEAGAKRENLTFYAAGGARFLEAPTVFDLGGLNISMLRKLFRERGLKLSAEACGRPFPCRLTLNPEEPSVTVKIFGEEEEKWPKS